MLGTYSESFCLHICLEVFPLYFSIAVSKLKIWRNFFWSVLSQFLYKVRDRSYSICGCQFIQRLSLIKDAIFSPTHIVGTFVKKQRVVAVWDYLCFSPQCTCLFSVSSMLFVLQWGWWDVCSSFLGLGSSRVSVLSSLSRGCCYYFALILLGFPQYLLISFASCVCAHSHAIAHVEVIAQRFSSSVMWGLQVELRSSGVTESTFTH